MNRGVQLLDGFGCLLFGLTIVWAAAFAGLVVARALTHTL